MIKPVVISPYHRLLGTCSRIILFYHYAFYPSSANYSISDMNIH